MGFKSCFFYIYKMVPLLQCFLSATTIFSPLFDCKLRIIKACCSRETQEDKANISQCFSFSHLTIKHRVLVLTHQRQTMHSDAYSNVFVFVVALFALPCLSMQKISFSAKMQMLQGTRTSSKRGQWPQASRGADTAFEPFKEALMCNL